MPIKITKPGKDISSTTPDDFYLDSNYPLLKVSSFGTFTTNILGKVTITHSLGYKPFVLVMSQFVDTDGLGSPVKSTEYYQHDWFVLGASVTFYGYTKIYDNTIDIHISNTDVDPTPGTVNGFYYIFKEEV
jgi:hypothetical protein